MTSSPDSAAPPPTPADRGTTSFDRAVFWSYLMDGSRVVTNLIVVFILARILGPEIFGIAAFALVFVLFVRLVVQNGMVAAIIQREELEERHLLSAFWIIVGIGAVLAGLTILSAPAWARLTDNPDMRPVLQVLSALIVIGSLAVVPEGLQRRQMNFRALAMRTSVAVVIGSIVAVIAAWQGAGVWSLVLLQLVTEAVGLVLLWFITDWRPRFGFDRRAARELFGFWSGNIVASAGSFLRWQVDMLLIDVFFPALTVGLYRFGARFPETWSEMSVRSLQSASLPELSKHADDPEKFRERIQAVVRLSAVAGIPVLGIIAGLSYQVVRLADLDKWGDANTAVKIFAVVVATKALTLFSAPILQALGKTFVLAALTWFHAAMAAIAFIGVGLWLGGEDTLAVDQVNAGSVSRVAVMLFAVIVDSVVLARFTSLHPLDIMRCALPSVVAGIAAFAATTAAVWLVGGLPALVVIALAGGFGGVVMLGVLVGIEPEARTLAAKLPVVGSRFA